MAKIYTSDLATVNNYAEAALQNEVADTDKIINNINTFVSSSTNLKGSTWDKERERLNTYLPALEKRKAVSTSLLSAVKAANKVMENYVEGFPWHMLARIPGLSISGGKLDCIDDSWSTELDASLKKAQSNYNSYHIEKDDTDKVKNSKARNLEHYGNIITACKAVIDYLGRLQPTAQTAYSKYEAVAAEIASLQSLNHDVNEQLFDNIDGKNDVVNKVYVPVYGGGTTVNNSTPVTPSTETETKTEESPKATTTETTTTETVVTPMVTPVATSVTPSVAAPASSVYVSPTVTTGESDVEITPEVTSEVEVDNNVIVDGNTNDIDTNEPIITPSTTESYVTTTTKTGGNSTMKKVGLGLVGAAAIGGAAYGAYRISEKIKENNELGEDPHEESIDDNQNINIKLDDNDDI